MVSSYHASFCSTHRRTGRREGYCNSLDDMYAVSLCLLLVIYFSKLYKCRHALQCKESGRAAKLNKEDSMKSHIHLED